MAASLLRFGPAATAGLLCAALLARESSSPVFFARYSAPALATAVAAGCLAVLALWAALRASHPLEPLAKLVLLVAGLGVGLGMGEALFRGALLESKIPASDREFERVIARHWPRPVAQGPAPRIRVLGLSDSFGVAGGDRNYHFLLETRLLEAGFEIEVANLSVSGLSPNEELEVLRRFGARYAPDLVVHGFFVGNDFVHAPGGPAHFAGVPIRRHQGIEALHPRNLTLVQLLAGLASARHDEALRRAEPASAPAATFSSEGSLRIAARTLDTLRADRDPREWQHTLATLDRMRDAAAALDAAFVMVIHPDRIQVDDALRTRAARRHGLDPSRYAVERPQEFLMSACEARGVACLDLLPRFREQAASAELYLPRDTHWSTEGNALAAAELARFLVERELLEAPAQLTGLR